MHDVLRYSTSFTNYASAAPHIVAFFAKIFAEIATDCIDFCSKLNKLCLFNTISVVEIGASHMILSRFSNTQKGTNNNLHTKCRKIM
jgi:hypothetical protein